MRPARFLSLLLLSGLLAACGKEEPTYPDAAFGNRSALPSSSSAAQDPSKAASPSTNTQTNTDLSTNPIPRPAVDPKDEVGPPPSNPALTDADLISAALEKANQIRRENGVPELELDPKLSLAAQKHAEDMVARKFFDHKNPDGKDPSHRASDAGARYRAVGENIAKGISQDVEQLFQLWMKSEPHRKGLLEKAFTHHGMGYKDGTWVHLLSGN